MLTLLQDTKNLINKWKVTGDGSCLHDLSGMSWVGCGLFSDIVEGKPWHELRSKVHKTVLIGPNESLCKDQLCHPAGNDFYWAAQAVVCSLP